MSYDQAFLDRLPLSKLEEARCSENLPDSISEIESISSHGDRSDSSPSQSETEEIAQTRDVETSQVETAQAEAAQAEPVEGA